MRFQNQGAWKRELAIYRRLTLALRASNSVDGLVFLSFVIFVEHQMPLEEREKFRVDTAIVAPVRLCPRSVVFFGFVNNPEFIQLVSEGLIRIHVILDWIAPCPVKLEAPQRFEVVSMLGD